MICKNCGAQLGENDVICTKCGAKVKEDLPYVLLTSYDREEQPETPERQVSMVEERRPSWVLGFLKLMLVALLVAAISGAGAYAYMVYVRPKLETKPDITFETGSGLINGDQPVIYTAIDGATSIEFIHGVEIFDCDITLDENADVQPVSTEYEYTKNVNSTFRCIFFDMSDIKLKKKEHYAYSFRMQFSFQDSHTVFTYTEVIPFDGKITQDVSDIVFDHSLKQNAVGQESTEPATTVTAPEASQTTSAADISFIYTGFWFSAPQTAGDVRTIYSYQFSQDLTFKRTAFEKKGSAAWKVTTDGGIFALRDGYIVLSSGADSEELFLKADPAAGTLTEMQNGMPGDALTNRKYNSIKNAEDFFGI